MPRYDVVLTSLLFFDAHLGESTMTQDDKAPPAYLIMTNVEPEDWCAAFADRRKLIGRDPQADVPARQTFVSRRHAEIWSSPKSLVIRDLGSKAGTHVNGVWLKANCDTALMVGDRIWLGGIELEVVPEVSLIAQVLAESGVVSEDYLKGEEDTDGGQSGVLTTDFRYSMQPIRRVLAELSRAELEIVLWIGRGYLDDWELGAKLFRSPNTIRTQVNSIFRKMKLHSRGDVLGFLKRGK
jgi:DNA-binding CsgD family transcriptional regulator